MPSHPTWWFALKQSAVMQRPVISAAGVTHGAGAASGDPPSPPSSPPSRLPLPPAEEPPSAWDVSSRPLGDASEVGFVSVRLAASTTPAFGAGDSAPAGCVSAV